MVGPGSSQWGSGSWLCSLTSVLRAVSSLLSLSLSSLSLVADDRGVLLHHGFLGLLLFDELSLQLCEFHLVWFSWWSGARSNVLTVLLTVSLSSTSLILSFQTLQIPPFLCRRVTTECHRSYWSVRKIRVLIHSCTGQRRVCLVFSSAVLVCMPSWHCHFSHIVDMKEEKPLYRLWLKPWCSAALLMSLLLDSDCYGLAC